MFFDRGWESWRWSDAKGAYVRVPNPRKPRAPRQRSGRKVHVLKLKAPDGSELRYVGGIKFARRGRAVRFDSKAHATAVGNELKRQFPVLRDYRLKAT